MKRCMLFTLLAVFLMVGCATGTSTENKSEAEGSNDAAADFPQEPIEMILPFPTGGNYDGAARILTKYAEKYLPNDQSFALINKTGGANTAGVTELSQTEPDGYTLGFVQTSTITTESHYGHVSYTHDSFQPIMKVLQVDGYMFINDDAPWETFDEWLDYVKEHPGEFKVSAVPGAVPLLETLKAEAGIDYDIVPFDGFAEATTALIGGHVDATIGTLPGMKTHLDSGDVRPLFSSTGRELEGDIPTLKDKGIDVEENKMVGLIAPKDLPQEKLDLLHDVFKQALDDPDLQEEFEQAGLEAVYAGPEEFQQDITDTYEFDRRILETAGLLE
ncbi:Tripartite-type tricarboxylate transporter, receptor component TctC [Alteribacillus persepolensis]|uniref:Tripartite-type tricarboxylate transporter, receptor component TctC n=1 Tax=Alteribacillus persepolensis TaxID=568899 RepID=A0A1G8AUX2_9BACI|nr:tripartite tricarboxylate transporter substrate binding protein [Alteribacillus persepolensis]SDH24759.1 Tripartite-type tricarboxylate transporter, receptor component TctC [Alteribacillus persepolensis]